VYTCVRLKQHFEALVCVCAKCVCVWLDVWLCVYTCVRLKQHFEALVCVCAKCVCVCIYG